MRPTRELLPPDTQTLNERRRKLVATLRAGTYAPGRGALFRHFNGLKHCCIGVGVRLCYTGPTDVDTLESIPGYDMFSAYYGVSEFEGLRAQLIAMNDGEMRTVNGLPRRLYCVRDHKFIARYLEIYWGLTDD